MKRQAAPLIVALIFLLVPYPVWSQSGTTPKGILLRTQKTIQTEDIDSILTLCREYRIDHIFLLVKQDTGSESGLLYFASPASLSIPQISDFDVLSYTLDEAHKKNIKVYAWIPLLYDRWASEKGYGMGDNWICPLQSASYYAQLVDNVAAYNIDGILFDYLRFSDDFAASEQLKRDFGQAFNYNMNSVELSLEAERSTQLWEQWIAYRKEVLSQFLEAIIPDAVPTGVTMAPKDLQYTNNDSMLPAPMDFVAAQVEEDPVSMINALTLSTEASTYAILPNDYVSQVRHLMSEEIYADMHIFDSDTWDESAFKRIKKAETLFEDVRMTKLPFLDFYTEKYEMEKWKSHEINTVALPAGHVFWTYFKYLPHKEKWSVYVERFDRDYLQDMITEAHEAGLYTVVSLNAQSEEYVTRYREAASITYQWGSVWDRICLSELNSDYYKTEFFDMARFLVDNYDAEAILITNISYLEDCFCTDCLESYVDFMAEQGVTVEDWPRTDGEIDIYNQTVREWKTAQITQFLGELREYLRDSNKELWVEIPVSANLEYLSSDYGLYLPELEQLTDRIVLMDIDMENPPRIEKIAKSLPNSEKYILSFPVPTEAVPARAYLQDSLKMAYEYGIESVGVYPHSALTDSLWGGFYIAYAYRLALTDEALMNMYREGDYGSVISTYYILDEKKDEEEKQTREKARQNIYEAQKGHSRVLNTLEDAKQVDLDITIFEAEIQYNLGLLSEAKTLFIDGSYQPAEEMGKTVIIEFSTLEGRINKMVRDERIERVTSGVLILVVFLLVMMYVRFKMRRRK